MILAGIDIGTNTLRLLIAEIRHDSIQELYADRIMTRLGQGLDKTGLISTQAGERSLAALEGFAKSVQRHGAVDSSAIGTSALRLAGNAAAFIENVRTRTGLSISIITGEEEARLTLLGVFRALKDRDSSPYPHYVLDIGGGSTEIIVWKEGKVLDLRSMTLGAVYMTERFIHTDPPSSDDRDRLRKAVKNVLSRNSNHPVGEQCVCIGTAGTITTLAAMDLKLAQYEPEAINGHVLSRTTLDAIIEALEARTLSERRAMPGLEKGREDIIYAGAVIVREIMGHINCNSMTVSDWGLREGVVIDLYERLYAGTGRGT